MLGFVFGLIDYNKMKSGKMPIFMIKITSGGYSKLNYIGLGYRMERNVGVSYKEPIYMDNEVKFGLWFWIDKVQIKKPTYSIETKEEQNCDSKTKLYYDFGNKKIYTSCLDSIKISDGNKKYELKDYIKVHSEAVDEIVNALVLEDSAMDGGTKIYKADENTKFTNNGLTIIKCNQIIEIEKYNQDIYIGTQEMEFKENYCKNNNETFIRTYTVKELEEYKDQQYENGIPVTYGKSLKVTLTQFQSETKTIIINNLWDELQKDKTYEFELYLYDYQLPIEDNIDSIFKKATIVSVKETDKIGLEQLQEKIR